jgi:hypothetical protein
MSHLQRIILMNAAILVGLIFEFAKGVPIRGLLVSALLLFSVANFGLWLKGRSSKRSTRVS